MTGALSAPKLAYTQGDLMVLKYTLLEPGYKMDKEWALGVLYASQEGPVLVGEDQVIYWLQNPGILKLPAKKKCETAAGR